MNTEVPMTAEKKWYLIHLRRNSERKVADLLLKKGIEIYYPVNKLTKSKQQKDVLNYMPLFEHRMFVNVMSKQIPAVLQTDGVLNFFYWLNSYAIIRNEDIEAMKIFLQIYNDVWHEKTDLFANDFSGPGNNMHINDSSATPERVIEKILLPSLGYYLLAEVEIKEEVFQHAI
ncbi:MAG: transcription termination/antitermination NusG family protein [Chitinophagaceae bacterium]